jgi:hypothetical protein
MTILWDLMTASLILDVLMTGCLRILLRDVLMDLKNSGGFSLIDIFYTIPKDLILSSFPQRLKN